MEGLRFKVRCVRGCGRGSARTKLYPPVASGFSPSSGQGELQPRRTVDLVLEADLSGERLDAGVQEAGDDPSLDVVRCDVRVPWRRRDLHQVVHQLADRLLGTPDG